MHADRGGSERRPLTILLTEGSSTSARQLLYCLQPDDVVDILDPNPLCQCRFSRWRRRLYRCPHYARDPLGYLSFLVGRLRAEKYDVLLVSHEHAYLLSRVRRQLGELVGLALPGFGAIRRMQDKAAFTRLVEEVGLRSPPTTIVRRRDELMQTDDFPCFVKTAHGTAGLGVHRVEGPDDLSRVADRLEDTGHLDGESEVLVQRPAAGELSVAFAVFQNGRLVGHHAARVRKYAIGNLARESVAQPGVVDDLRRLGAHLDWHGAFFLDYFFDPTSGARQYIEANPRPGELVNARLSGANLCEQLIRVALGEEIEPLPAGRTGVRSHQSYLSGLAVAAGGGSRTQVLREVLSACRGRGSYEMSADELVRPREDPYSVLPAIAVVAELAFYPGFAGRIVGGTVENYGLAAPAARRIAELPAERLAACFED